MLGYTPGSRPTPPGSRPTPPGTRPPPEETPHPPGSGRHPPGPGRPPPGSRLQHTVNERPVRILLECILVNLGFQTATFVISGLSSAVFGPYTRLPPWASVLQHSFWINSRRGCSGRTCREGTQVNHLFRSTNTLVNETKV